MANESKDEELTTYYYETHRSASTRKLLAPNDEAALQQLKNEYGEHLSGVMIVYVEESKDNIREVWVE